MDNINWWGILATVLESLIPILVTAFGVWLCAWLKKKGATEEQLSLLKEAYSLLTRAAINTNQVFVDGIKASGGKLTEDQQASAREQTTKIFNELLTDSMKLAVESAYGSIDKFIKDNLEAAVGEAKTITA